MGRQYKVILMLMYHQIIMEGYWLDYARVVIAYLRTRRNFNKV